MQLIRKRVKGQSYWYLVQKGRKNGTVTNVKTIYIGKPERIAQILQEVDTTAADFPKAFRSRELGASAALWAEAEKLSLVDLIDRACGPRRKDASVSYGELLVTAAIHQAIAPRALKSNEKLRTWYESAGLSEFLRLDSTGLDPRRVHEAVSQLRASDIEQMEQEIVDAMVRVHNVSLESLAFDATNFDSYAGSRNPSRLLKRGKAKSKRSNLRILGLGLLVTAEDGLPLLSFVYPGNQHDSRSYRSFLRRLRKRKKTLGLPSTATVVCDGGNISKKVVTEMEADGLHYVARLPIGHCLEADSLRTSDLHPVKGKFGGKVRAKKLTAEVYGKERTVVATYSESMHKSQLPGLERDIRKVKDDLTKLQARLRRQRDGKHRGKSLTTADVRKQADKARERQHMADLFTVSIGGTNAKPTLRFWFKQQAWKDLEECRLGRTAVITTRNRWGLAQIIKELRKQSHAEDAFKGMKDPEWIAALPLRHRTDPMLRLHGFLTVLGQRLSMLVVRRLRLNGVTATVSEALWQLSELRLAKVRYSAVASPLLRRLAESNEIPPDPTPRQDEIVQALGLKKALKLGPTRKPRNEPVCAAESTN
jgi:transposase